MFTKDGIKLIGISGKDVNDNNEKLILGYSWSIFLHYSICGDVADNNSAKKLCQKSTFEWTIGRTADCPKVNIEYKNHELNKRSQKSQHYHNNHKVKQENDNFASENKCLNSMISQMISEITNLSNKITNESFEIKRLNNIIEDTQRKAQIDQNFSY